MIYELQITLKDMPLVVSRTIQIDSESTFYELHRVLQAIFNWEDYHLHSFQVEKSYGKDVDMIVIELENELEDDSFLSIMSSMNDSYDEEEELLSEWFKFINDTVTYTYDFGDNWEHEITLTKVLSSEKGIKYPRCIAAKNAAPEEDSRFEIIRGLVNLEANDEKVLSNIRRSMRMKFFNLLCEVRDEGANVWQQLLESAKEFHKQKPWTYLSDEQIFAISDPETDELLYCSVMGASEEVFGLAVYIGREGFRALLDTVKQEPSELDLMILKQRSIVVSYEDRNDLQKEDYALIKTSNVAFRGKKSWPVFMSYKPGFYPWMIDDEEARMMTLAFQGTMGVLQDIKNDIKIPSFYDDGQLYIKSPVEDNNKTIFATDIIELELNEHNKVGLKVIELDVKRAKKLPIIQASVEFTLEYMKEPIQFGPNERPFFPVLVIAADHEQGAVVYYDMPDDVLSPEMAQFELLELFQELGGIPNHIMMDEETAENIEPLIEELKLNVQTDDYESIVEKIIEDFYHTMLE